MAYVIGLPLVVFVFLFRNRHELSKEVVTMRYGLFLNGKKQTKTILLKFSHISLYFLAGGAWNLIGTIKYADPRTSRLLHV